MATGAPHVADRGSARSKRVLVGCYRGMGDLLYVSSILGQLREETPPSTGIDLAAGRGLWADAVRHLPAADRIVPIDSWEDIRRVGARDNYSKVLAARVSEWMPFAVYRGWSLRARLSGLHLVDVLARTLGVKLRPENRRPVYYFSPDDPEDDPGPPRQFGSYAVVALHGFTHAAHNEAAQERLLLPLVADAVRRGHRLVVVGPPAEWQLPESPAIRDLRGAPIRPVAAWVSGAALVVSVLNGIAVLADALGRPLVLLALGRDPLPVVGPLTIEPVRVFGKPGARGMADVPVPDVLEAVARHLAP